MRTLKISLPWLALCVLPAAAQDQPPSTPAPTGVAAAVAPPVLENTGKPMVLPYQCSAEEVQSVGLSCSEEEPCPMYLELTAIEATAARIVAAGNIHGTSVTIGTVLLVSEDSGRTWREAFEHIPSAGLDRIQFLDADTGWTSGETLFPLPQDPFLLVTFDGGKTWRRSPIFNDSRENRYGSVQQFFFTAKNSGSLIVDRGQGADGDRYELYESTDGGDTWTVRQTSNKPLSLPRSAAPSSDWRLRVDARTRAYHVEHRQGQNWGSVASFAVRLAPCK